MIRIEDMIKSGKSGQEIRDFFKKEAEEKLRLLKLRKMAEGRKLEKKMKIKETIITKLGEDCVISPDDVVIVGGFKKSKKSKKIGRKIRGMQGDRDCIH